MLWIESRRTELIIAFAVLWIAYGFLGFNLSTAGDDWVALTDDSILVRYALENGRWLHALLMIVQDHSRAAPTFSIAVLLLAILAAMAMFANALQLKRRGSVVLFIVLAGCFPFWAEFASFRILQLPGALALLLSCGYGYVIWQTAQPSSNTTPLRRMIRSVTAGLLFSLSAATYQGFLPVGVMLLGCYLLGSIHDHHQRIGVRVCLQTLIVFVVGVLLYTAQVLLVRAVTGVAGSPEPTYQLASSLVSNLDDMQITITRLASYLWAFYAQPNHLFPLWPKLVFLVVLLAFVLRGLFAREFAPLGKRLWLFAVLGLLVLAPWALGLIRVPDPYRYNAIVSSGLIYSVVICFTLEHMRAARGRVIVFCAGAAIAVCFVFQQNAASNITHQNNVRDMAVLNRLLDRLTQAENYQQLSRHAPVNVVLSGEFQQPPERPFRSTPVDSVLRSSIVDCDILRCQPARLDWVAPLIGADTTRYNFVHLANQSPAYQAILRPVIAKLAAWPAQGSVHIVDDTTVVVRLVETRHQPNAVAKVGITPVTSTGDGFVLAENGTGAFSVALSNFAEAASYRLIVDSTVAVSDESSISTLVCQTEPTKGTCIADPLDGGIDVKVGTGQSATFAIFVNITGRINKDVLRNRLVVRLVDDAGHICAATSVAVTSDTLR